MNRTEMIDELLERLETELDELDNGQLSSLLTEYENSPMLEGVVESLAIDEEADDESDEETEDDGDPDELTLIDGDWPEEVDED